MTESKTDDIDSINFPGYTFKMKNHKKISRRRSGGIIVGFKDSLTSCIEVIETECKYVLWFKCGEKLLTNVTDTYFGIVYIPSENTKYSSDDAFGEIEQEYLNFVCKSKYICLIGDFNARTSNESDFVDISIVSFEAVI